MDGRAECTALFAPFGGLYYISVSWASIRRTLVCDACTTRSSRIFEDHWTKLCCSLTKDAKGDVKLQAKNWWKQTVSEYLELQLNIAALQWMCQRSCFFIPTNTSCLVVVRFSFDFEPLNEKTFYGVHIYTQTRGTMHAVFKLTPRRQLLPYAYKAYCVRPG